MCVQRTLRRAASAFIGSLDQAVHLAKPWISLLTVGAEVKVTRQADA